MSHSALPPSHCENQGWFNIISCWTPHGLFQGDIQLDETTPVHNIFLWILPTSHHSGSSWVPATDVPYRDEARWEPPFNPRHCCLRHTCSSLHCLPSWPDWGIDRTFSLNLHSLLPSHVETRLRAAGPWLWSPTSPSRQSCPCCALRWPEKIRRGKSTIYLFLRFAIAFTSRGPRLLTSSSAFVFGRGKDLTLSLLLFDS